LQDVSAAASRYGSDRTYAASTENNALDNQTAVRGQNVTANTALATNKLDNQRQALTSLFGELSPGQVRPAVPDEIAGLLGMPAIGKAHGNAPTLSLDQVQAQERQKLGQSGALTDQMLLDAIVGKEAPVQVIGPDGKTPAYSTPGAAARTGAQPFVNKEAEAKPDIVNYQAPDGKTQGTAYFNGQTMVDTQTEQPIPQGSQTYKAQTSGAVGDVLGVKTTEAQDKNAYAATMADGATTDILKSFDTGALPSGTDFQIFNAMRNLPIAAQPALVGQMTPQGQNFYQNLRVALPFQLMSQSGQAVTEQEYERKMLELMPVPGEDRGVTAGKRRQFETYIKAARGVAGPAYDKIHQRGGIPETSIPATTTAKRLKFDTGGNEMQ